MYRWLLCWRYLRTRYIALASVVSVMLGVATLIIVNSVMDGFTSEMQQKMHGILSDVIVESHSAYGLPNSAGFKQRIQELVGDELVGITTVVHVPAMVSINHRGETLTRQINLIGIDTDSYASVSDFSKYLLHPDNQKQIAFALRESGYAPGRDQFPEAGWEYRRKKAKAQKKLEALQREIEAQQARNAQLREQIDSAPMVRPPFAVAHAGGEVPFDNSNVLAASAKSSEQKETSDQTQKSSDPSHGLSMPAAPQHLGVQTNITNSTAASNSESNPTGPTGIPMPSNEVVPTRPEDVAHVFDAEKEQREGIVLGISIGMLRFRDEAGEIVDYYNVQPGDDVLVTFPSAGDRPQALNHEFTVVDFYESKMFEYDSTFAFIDIKQLQQFRGMRNDAVTSIQLKLADGTDLDSVRDTLRAEFPPQMMIQVSTWRDLQGALLAAVQMETRILNILLFLIIAVAGFGILATFFMIVVEKTKDIGILKSLGASGTGVASIFLGYGVLLGAFGAGVGAVAGLIFVANINTIADLLEATTGQEVFDPTVYYFETIPTIVHPGMVVSVIIGAVMIAVAASVLPSIRAARMHPVQALRYE